ncbi:MAG TPA: hypothetical protein VH912_32675 [Streptosporangiaceae bacterium]|jgi:hypothetical protein
MRHKVLTPLLAVALVAAIAGPAYAKSRPGGLGQVKHVTAKYHSVGVAEHAGYGRFVDINGVACIDMPGMGGMGVHYVNGSLVGDGKINPLTPEAVVYEPGRGGRLHLVAVEYVVIKEAWDAGHRHPPMLFGHRFNFTASPNRYGLPPFYSLHAWVWKHNPAGTFAMWNPRVHCPG